MFEDDEVLDMMGNCIGNDEIVVQFICLIIKNYQFQFFFKTT